MEHPCSHCGPQSSCLSEIFLMSESAGITPAVPVLAGHSEGRMQAIYRTVIKVLVCARNGSDPHIRTGVVGCHGSLGGGVIGIASLPQEQPGISVLLRLRPHQLPAKRGSFRMLSNWGISLAGHDNDRLGLARFGDLGPGSGGSWDLQT